VHPTRSRSCVFPGLGIRKRGRAARGCCLGLLAVGFTLPRRSPAARCALTAPFHPYHPKVAVSFLWHCPSARAGLALPTTVPCPVRTFLTPISRCPQAPTSRRAIATARFAAACDHTRLRSRLRTSAWPPNASKSNDVGSGANWRIKGLGVGWPISPPCPTPIGFVNTSPKGLGNAPRAYPRPARRYRPGWQQNGPRRSGVLVGQHRGSARDAGVGTVHGPIAVLWNLPSATSPRRRSTIPGKRYDPLPTVMSRGTADFLHIGVDFPRKSIAERRDLATERGRSTNLPPRCGFFTMISEVAARTAGTCAAFGNPLAQGRPTHLATPVRSVRSVRPSMPAGSE
jgi:hypothetical protein